MFDTTDVWSIFQGSDGEYNDGVNAYVDIAGDKVTLTDPDTEESVTFRVSLERIG